MKNIDWSKVEDTKMESLDKEVKTRTEKEKLDINPYQQSEEINSILER